MKKNIIDIVDEVLRENEKYVAENGSLLKANVYTDIMAMNSELINQLISNEKIKNKFFVKIGDTFVFDKQSFLWFLESKEFLPDSYTIYANKIGLASDGKFIQKNNDVVLDFPYKDCVLEGGQTKEDQKRNEIFFNETIADKEVTRMLSPKVFSNAKRYTKDGVEENVKYETDDNLLIKGNNLISISSLLPKYENKIKLIYIDPPYNTGSDDFSYNDSFNRSAWLTFMKNRLEIAKRLLAPEGAIYVQLDYHQAHYCKVLMDEIFGENNFQREIIWRIGWLSGYKCNDNNWIRNHDTILFYSKNNSSLKFNKKTIPNCDFKEFIDNQGISKIIKDYELCKKDNQKISKEDEKNIVNYFNHESRPEKYYIEDVWNASEYDDLNSIAIVSFSGETVSKMLNPDDEVKGQKSEKLIERIINAHTEPGDIVLDFFGGTGTTGAVAMKMKRRFILCEQLDKHIDIAVRRLNKVIEGEQSGISKRNAWNGGGSFIFCELKENAESLLKEIADATDDTIGALKDKIYSDERIVSYIKTEDLVNSEEEFDALDLESKKRALASIIDKNKLYVNYSDMCDEEYEIEESDKEFTNSLYDKE